METDEGVTCHLNNDSWVRASASCMFAWEDALVCVSVFDQCEVLSCVYQCVSVCVNECNPVASSSIRTAPALWRGAAPSVNCERRYAAAARNWSASWKAAARPETASPKTPGNYPNRHPTDPPAHRRLTLCTAGLEEPAGPPASARLAY